MKRVMRCHDFRSDQGVRRRQYREYCRGAGRRDGRKVVPALRVATKTAAHFVGLLADIRDISFVVLRVIDRFGSQRTRVSSCYGLLRRLEAFGAKYARGRVGRQELEELARRIRLSRVPEDARGHDGNILD